MCGLHLVQIPKEPRYQEERIRSETLRDMPMKQSRPTTPPLTRRSIIGLCFEL